MFDIGFGELVVVAIVALLVVGPERLPGMIKTASLWIGRIRRSFNEIKSDLEREVGADEIRQQLHNEAVLKQLAATEEEAQASITTLHENMNREATGKPSSTDSTATLGKPE